MVQQRKCAFPEYNDYIVCKEYWIQYQFRLYKLYMYILGLSWGEAQASAKDRTLWREIVVALCPTGDEEEK